MEAFYVGIIATGVICCIYIVLYNIYIRLYLQDNYSIISENV